MVTLSVTRSRVARVLNQAASLLEIDSWDPLQNPLMLAIDEAAGWDKPGVDDSAEETTLQAWEALSAHLCPDWALHVNWLGQWEHESSRTQAEVVAALRAAAEAVMAP